MLIVQIRRLDGNVQVQRPSLFLTISSLVLAQAHVHVRIRRIHIAGHIVGHSVHVVHAPGSHRVAPHLIPEGVATMHTVVAHWRLATVIRITLPWLVHVLRHLKFKIKKY